MFYRFRTIAVLAIMIFMPAMAAPQKPSVKIRYESPRAAFVRAEQAQIMLAVRNNLPANIFKAELSIDIAGLIKQNVAIEKIKKRTVAKRKFTIDTTKLKAGSYTMKCKITRGEKVLGEAELPFHVARQWNKNRMPMWQWGGYGRKLTDANKEKMHWYTDKGFTSKMINSTASNRDFYETLDYVLINGWDLTIKAAGGFLENVDDPNVMFKPRKARGKHEMLTNPFHPKVAQNQNKLNRASSLYRREKESPGN